MSLVNQMLRDLDKRRAGERHGPGSTFEGLVSSAEPRHGGTGLFVAVAVVVVLLGGVAGYLMWERRAPASGAAPKSAMMGSVAALHTAVVAPPAASPEQAPSPASSVPVTPGFVALEPVPERIVKPVVAANPEQARPAQVDRKREQTKSPLVTAPARTEREVVAERPAVDIRALPPTPQQLASAAYQKGYEALGAGRQEEAERQLHEALRHDPEHMAARESLAALLLSGGRRVEAGELLDQGLKLKPQVPGFRKLKARLQVEQNDLAAAVTTLEGGAEGAARDGEYQALMGALYQRQGDFARSVQRYQQALLIAPTQNVWWLGLAISAERGGQNADALAAYRRALETGIRDRLAAYAKERIVILEKATNK